MIAALIIVWYILASLGLILFCSMQVKASESYFPMQQNENGNIPQYIIDYFNDNYAEDYFIVLRWWGHNASFNEDYIYFIMFPKTNDFMLYGEILNNGYQFSLYNVGNNIGGLSNGYMGFRNGSQSDYWNGGQNITGWQSLNSSLYDSGTDFVSNFKIWTSNNESNRSVVLKYGADEEVIDVGHAVHPHFDGLHPHYGNTVTPPDEVPPTYTINNYSWTTYNNPSVDNSSTDALLESIFDILSYNAGYLKTNISNEFDNLILNLKGLVDYLGETLQYYGDLIIDNIQNGIQNLYDNMAALVQPIYEKVAELTDLVTNPFDSEEFEEQLNDSTFYSSLDTTITSISTFGTSLTHATEPENLTLTLNLTSIGWGTAEIDFNWLKPFRNIIRLIIGCVLIYWLAIEVITGLNNVIGSGGDNEE